MVYHEIVALERRNRDWRRVQYEDRVRNNPLDYKSWHAYITLEEDGSAAANKQRMRALYGRAIANVRMFLPLRTWTGSTIGRAMLICGSDTDVALGIWVMLAWSMSSWQSKRLLSVRLISLTMSMKLKRKNNIFNILKAEAEAD